MAYLADRDGGTRMDMGPRDVTKVQPAETVAALNQVEMRYPDQDAPALQVETLSIGKGERVALIGPSGGGKTTLLRLMNGTLAPTAGAIDILGASLSATTPLSREQRRRTGMIFQGFALVERATVLQNVLSVGSAMPIPGCRCSVNSPMKTGSWRWRRSPKSIFWTRSMNGSTG